MNESNKHSDFYLLVLVVFCLLHCNIAVAQSPFSKDVSQKLDAHAKTNLVSIDENTIVNFITQTLYERFCDKNQTLEIHLSRPWATVTVTNCNGSLRLLDLPGSILPSMILRIGWQNGNNLEVSWQVVLYAKVWTDVIVASKSLTRGTILTPNDIGYIKKDTLQIRDYLTTLPDNTLDIELVENVQQGQLILPRSVRIKPIVRRGQLADAFHVDGALNITLKVEVMEDGAAGQYIKIKNPQTRKELKGKVKNDGSIEICL